MTERSLVERLRIYADSEQLRGYILPDFDVPLGTIPKSARLAEDLREAADAIAALTRELEEAREALGSLLGYWEDDEHVASDVLHARAILNIAEDRRLSREQGEGEDREA